MATSHDLAAVKLLDAPVRLVQRDHIALGHHLKRRTPLKKRIGIFEARESLHVALVAESRPQDTVDAQDQSDSLLLI